MPDKSCRKFPDKFVWGFLILSGSLLSGSIVFFSNFDRFFEYSNTRLGLANAESKSAVRGFVDSNISYRDNKVSQVLDTPPRDTSEVNNSEADIYVSPFGSDNQVQGSVTTTNTDVVFVADQGSDNNPGSQKSPYRSLARAIKQAIRIQDGNKNKSVLIKLAAGTYSSNSGESETIEIPPSVSVVGSGDTTIMKAGIKIYNNSNLENLKIVDSWLTIGNDRSGNDERQNASVNIKKITISRAVEIYSSPKLSNVKVFSEVSVGAIYIDRGTSPTFNNVKINGNYIGIKNRVRDKLPTG